MASQIIVGSFGTHPVAQQAAQQRQQFAAVTPEMFQQYMDQLRRNSLLVPPQGSKGVDIPIIYTSAEDRARQQGIVPCMSGQGQRLSADDMSDIVHSGISTKRRSSDPPTPKAKAKVEAVEEEGYVFTGKTAKNPVKKTEIKQEKVLELEDQLSEELTSSYYNRGTIRSAFVRRFPDNTKIPDESGTLQYISASNKSDVIKEWMKRVKAKGAKALSSEINQLKE